MIKNVHTHIVIMAGGIGSRLWPSVCAVGIYSPRAD